MAEQLPDSAQARHPRAAGPESGIVHCTLTAREES